MKNAKSVLLFVILLLSFIGAGAQSMPDSTKINSGKMFIITKNDGVKYVGKILAMDPKEVVVDTKNMGQVSIPKHEIKEIREVRQDEISARGDFKTSEVFATRYFITTNGLPIEKGSNYILWNWYGPDIQFGVGKNFGIGVMTSWIGMPVIGSAKYTIETGKNTHIALGTLLGTGSWAFPKFGLALPFASLTYGSRRNNITFSGGYGAVWGYGMSGGRALCSVAGMVKLTEKASFVFDSFIMPANVNNEYAAIYIPGFRIQTSSNKAFQFGFTGITSNGTTGGMPMIQWFRML